MLGVKIGLCPPQAKKILLSGSKIVIFVQFGASERGVSPRNQVLARLVLTPGPKQVLACSNTWPNSVLAQVFEHRSNVVIARSNTARFSKGKKLQVTFWSLWYF